MTRHGGPLDCALGRFDQPGVTVDLCRFCGAPLDAAFAGVPRPRPELPQGCLDGDWCSARWSDAVGQRPVASGRSCSIASTSGTPGGSSGLTLATRPMVVARRSDERASCRLPPPFCGGEERDRGGCGDHRSQAPSDNAVVRLALPAKSSAVRRRESMSYRDA
jgi:hypothetical protein